MIEMFCDTKVDRYDRLILYANFTYKPPLDVFWDDALLEALKDIESVIDKGMKEMVKEDDGSLDREKEELREFRNLLFKTAKNTDHWTLHRDFGSDHFIWVTNWIEEDY